MRIACHYTRLKNFFQLRKTWHHFSCLFRRGFGMRAMQVGCAMQVSLLPGLARTRTQEFNLISEIVHVFGMLHQWSGQRRSQQREG
jgi:hypothetical protein